MAEIASDIGASGEEVEPRDKAEQEQDVTEAVFILEQSQIKEKTYLDQKKEELIVEKQEKLKYKKMLNGQN